MFEVKQLEEEIGSIQLELNKISANAGSEKRSMTNEELAKFDKLWAAKTEKDNQYETAKRMALTASFDKNKADEKRYEIKSYKPEQITKKDKDLAFKCWMLRQSGNNKFITADMQAASRKLGIDADNKDWTLKTPEDYDPNNGKWYEGVRDQSSSTTTEGGHLLNDSLFQSLERARVAFGGVRSIANVIRTATGETYHWSYSDDTANSASIVAQNGGVSNTSVVYSRRSCGAFTYLTSVYPVSMELVQDARYDISADIGDCLGERLGRGSAAHFATGAGTTQPEGFIPAATIGKTCASASAITYAELVDFYNSVDPAYQNHPSAAFVMNQSTLGYLWKIVDGASRPLFWNANNDLTQSGKLSLFGKPIVVDQGVASITGSAKVMAFGAWNQFIIRDTLDPQVFVQREALLASDFALGFIGAHRTDCLLKNTKAIKTLRMG